MTNKSQRLHSQKQLILRQWTSWTIYLAWTQLLKSTVTQWAVLIKLIWEDHQLECSLTTFSATWWTLEPLKLNRFNSKTTWTSWAAIHSEKADLTIMPISKPTKQAGTHSVKKAVGSIQTSSHLPSQMQNWKRHCRLRPLETKTRNRVFRFWRPLTSITIPSSWNYSSSLRMKVEVQSPTSISWSTKMPSASVPTLLVQNTASHIQVHLRHRKFKPYHSKSTNKTLILNHLQRTHSLFNWL